MEKNSGKNLSLRIFAGTIMALIVFLFIILAIFVTRKLHANNDRNIVKGDIILEDNTGLRAPIYLNGEWEVFEGYLEGVQELPSQFGDSGTYQVFPIGSITDATQDATYRVRMEFPEIPSEDVYLSIPTYEGSLDVYVNGTKKEALPSGEDWIASSALQLLVPLDYSSRQQEIVISGDFSEKDTTLFRRPVVLGTLRNLTTLVTLDGFVEVFAFGILVLVIVNGCVFMLFRPGHKVISFITLFDVTILARILFSLKYTIGLLQSIFPGFRVSDAMARSAELFFLMLGGIVGCILSSMLYDPKATVAKRVSWIAPIFYAAFGLFFPFNMALFEKYGSILLMILYTYTFIVVFMQYKVSWHITDQRKYYLFQFIRTGYIGMVVLSDILMWTKYKDFSALLYAYVIFFILHVVVRLYDNNLSYQHVEVLNQSLEATVEERTKELSRANQILSELSIRDPLTNIFNRLYFEQRMEAALAERTVTPKNLHLCIFDLDYFKQVNDTYGHDVGDEVLIKATQLVQQTITEDVVLARIGGEEFILLFDGYGDSCVHDKIKEVREVLERNAKENTQHTTASFGIAAWREGTVNKVLLKAADEALYEAKNSGRNCIVFAK